MENNNIQMNENIQEKDKKKGKGIGIDVITTLLAIVVLVVCYFFWGCKYDLPATILALVVVFAGSAVICMQHKRVRKDDENSAEA